MALVLADRVKETTTTTSTGTITLAGTSTGYQSFSVIGNGNTTYYAIVHQTANEWEVGIGTYTSSGTTLSRDTVLASTNSGSKVNFSSGTKDVFVTYPAERSVNLSSAALTSGRVPYATTSGLLVDSANLTFDGTTLTAAGFSGPLNGTVGATTPAAGTFTSLSDSGNLTFTGTGNRITGDFSNATVANRVMFQTSTVNGATSVYIIPNGTSTTSQFVAVNNSDPTNAGVLQAQANSTDIQFRAGITGTGSYLPMTFYTGGSERMRIDSSGNVGIGSSAPSYKLQVSSGSAAATNYGYFAGNVGTGSAPTATFGILLGSNYSGGNSESNLIWGQGIGSGQYFAIGKTTGSAYTEQMRIDSSGNVGIGTISPSTTLTVKTAISNAGISVNDGTVNTILYNTASINGSVGTTTNHPMAFYANNSERMRIDTSGNVGIGTSSPAAKLDVENGSLLVQSTANTVYAPAIFRNTNNGSSAYNLLQFGNDATTSATQFGCLSSTNTTYGGAGSTLLLANSGALQAQTQGAYPFIFGTNSSERMRIDSSGNVGIGTSSPTNISGGGDLTVAGRCLNGTTGASYPGFSFTTDAQTGMFMPSSGNLGFATANTERMRITSSGNVGIGQSSQVWDEKLGVRLATSGAGTVGLGVYSASTGYTSSCIRVQTETGGSGWKMYEGRANGGSQLFWVDGSGGAYFAGNVGIGTSSPAASLSVVKQTTALSGTGNSYGLYMYPTSSGLSYIDAITGTTGNTSLGLRTYNNGTYNEVRLDSSGYLTCAGVYSATVGATNRDVYVDNTGLIGYVSSIRASKTEIQNLTDVSWLNQLNPVSFKYRKKDEDGNYTDETDGDIQYGMIAEDVEQVRPDLCFYDEIDGEQELRGIQYSKLVPVMLKAIQELNAKVAALEAKLNQGA